MNNLARIPTIQIKNGLHFVFVCMVLFSANVSHATLMCLNLFDAKAVESNYLFKSLEPSGEENYYDKRPVYEFGLFDKSNQTAPVALLIVKYDAVRLDLEVDGVLVDKLHRNMGLSELLVQKALGGFPPESVKSVSAVMTQDNKKIFFNAFRSNGGDVKKALMQTPFYKAFARLGFSEFDLGGTKFSPANQTVQIRLVRPIDKF